jgi:alpha-amylase/alpha-mannosidase (GH57 family)
VVVHGHFYQPPRENPWIERIEQQESAWPAHDWNERVSRECYGPNTHARILDAQNRIIAITNNYARMSFNLGPTLLGWMEHAQPHVYREILAADRESATRFGGHGAAMAQVYNHMILPLANRRDKVTQVRWGIRDFTRRFGRHPEGMWLAETAVDVESLEVLAEHEIRFTVLAPHQCARVRRPGGPWEDVSGQRVDPRRPYLCRLPSGRTIALFFYDGPISRAVAFERLLDDGHRFAERLLGAFVRGREEPQLVHIATDGESYGHHHPYGEMALAVALARIERERGVRLSTYGEVLELMPPTWEAQIAPNTSWSCAHGVERWRSDCGCASGGGSHQKWRAPLRASLDWLRDELAGPYEREANALLKDAWEARDAYVDVVVARGAASEPLPPFAWARSAAVGGRRHEPGDPGDRELDAFFAAHGKSDLSVGARQRALELLELQRHAMLMYTSCGWVFDELSGIEAVQVLQYAGRAIQLAERLFGVALEAGFRERLARAPSNRPEYGTGDRVYDALVAPSRVELRTVGACFAIETVFDDAEERSRIGGFEGEVLERDLSRSGASRLSIGRLRVRSRVTTEQRDFDFAVLHLGDHNLLGGIRESGGAPPPSHDGLSESFSRADLTEVIREIERVYGAETFSLRTLFHDEQAAVLERLLEDRTHAAEELYESMYEQTGPLMRFLQSLEQPSPPAFRAAAEYTLMAHLRRELGEGREVDLRRVTELVEEAEGASVRLDPVVPGLALQGTLEALLRELERTPDDRALLTQVGRVASFAAASKWKMELGEAQNTAWKLAERLLPAWREAPDRRRVLEGVLADLGMKVPA